MMDQLNQSVIKEECDINWDARDNSHGICSNETPELKIIKTEEDTPTDHVPPEINGTYETYQFETVGIKVESSNCNPPSQVSDNATDNLIKKYSYLNLKSKVIIIPLKKCPKCGKNTEKFHDHFPHCENKYLFYCIYCPYEVSTKTDLNAHVRILRWHTHIRFKHLQNKPVACDNCGKKVKPWSLNQHRRNCMKKTKKFCCDHCTFRSKFKKSVMKHLISRHSTGDSVDCPECHRKIKNESKLMRHLEYCKTVPKLQCKICLYTTKKKSCFAKHVSSSHF